MFSGFFIFHLFAGAFRHLNSILNWKIKNREKQYYLMEMELNSNGHDDVHHDYDDDLDLDTLDCYYFSIFLHSVQMLVMHDHVPNLLMSIYYYNSNVFDMMNAVDTDDVGSRFFDQILFLFRGT